MDLTHDLLDKRVLDRHGRDMGRVDRVVLGVHHGEPPTVRGFEVGPTALAWRVRPVFGRWVAALEHATGAEQDRTLRIPFRDVLGIHTSVRVDLAFGETAAATVEQRLRRWLGAIPG